MNTARPPQPPGHLTRWLTFLTLAAVILLPAAVPSRAENEPVPPEVESAVDRGLEWLAHNQQRDGSWAGGSGRGSRSAAVTGLATMAFMARGHVPGQGPYGENLNHAFDYLLSLQQADGALAVSELSQVMYDHGIATVALCEGYGMLDDRRQQLARTAISRAVRLILNAQNVRKSDRDQGGWRYTPTASDSDISVTGWQLMALRGAANIGANVPVAAINAGIAYIKRCAVVGGGFCYTPGSQPNAARSGTGILALVLLGKPDAPEVKSGGDYLLRTPFSGSEHYFYSVYYCSQAAWQLGGSYWTDLNREISQDIRRRQVADGSWSAASPADNQGGENYCTAMAILALSVPYRYLPIYQR